VSLFVFFSIIVGVAALRVARLVWQIRRARAQPEPQITKLGFVAIFVLAAAAVAIERWDAVPKWARFAMVAGIFTATVLWRRRRDRRAATEPRIDERSG
jgi:hypothetical protein